jgi:hypothetical protein
MLRNAMLLALSVSALVALAAPAMAQADELADSGGPLEAGAEITATSRDLALTTALGTVECERVILHGHIVENDDLSIVIMETEAAVEGCNTTVNPAFGSIQLGAGGGLSFGSSFSVAEGLCTFSGFIPFVYFLESDTLEIWGAEQLAGNCGVATVEGSFTLETENGTPVFIV